MTVIIPPEKTKTFYNLLATDVSTRITYLKECTVRSVFTYRVLINSILLLPRSRNCHK